jgi:segregation and condensation protein B
MNRRARSLGSQLALRGQPWGPPSGRPWGGQMSPPVQNGALFATAPKSDQENGSEVVTNRSLRRARLEAVLFLAREPVGLRKLAQSANLADATEARTLLGELRKLYDQRGCAFQVEQLAGGYQLLTRPKFASWLRPLVPSSEQIRLSPPALETLSVVAYRQPVLRADVEAIRGVACGEILRQLMERDLLRIVGRSEELGRPLWYGTTRRFLQVFGLSSLDDLPFAAQLRRAAESDANSRTNSDEISSAETDVRVDAA